MEKSQLRNIAKHTAYNLFSFLLIDIVMTVGFTFAATQIHINKPSNLFATLNFLFIILSLIFIGIFSHQKLNFKIPTIIFGSILSIVAWLILNGIIGQLI